MWLSEFTRALSSEIEKRSGFRKYLKRETVQTVVLGEIEVDVVGL